MKNIKIKLLVLAFSLCLYTPVVVQAQVVPDPIPTCETDPTLCVPPPTCDTDPTLCPPPAPSESILIRNGDTIIFQGTVDLPMAGTINIPDNTGTIHAVNADSVLGTLYTLDQFNNAFSISNLQYYDSFGAFYLKCITSSTESCDNWQYVVGGTTPWQSIDQSILTGGENIGIYFGAPYKVVLDQNTIQTTDSLNVTAERYDYENNAWNPRTGVTIGLTQPDPNNPWNPIEVQTNPVDAHGVASFQNIPAGTYNVGVQQDYYFPTEVVTVTAVAVGCGCGRTTAEVDSPVSTFSVPDAVSYLLSIQSTDGSFGGSDMYTDWASIALVAGGITDTVKTSILNYMLQHTSISQNLTDNERHAMALLALGQDPYSFHSVDYITPILNSFDGTQFGDPSLVNDDIFAILPLASAGYTASDDNILKDIQFILAQQKSDGSWEESSDMTSAGIQALSRFSEVAGVPASLDSAKHFLTTLQNDDGGWGNVPTTSWVLQAAAALHTPFLKNEKNGTEYLTIHQDDDGGLLAPTETVQNRIWATSYAIPAFLGTTWESLFHSVAKPVQAPVDPVRITKETTETIEHPVVQKVKKVVSLTKPKIEKTVTLEPKNLTASVINSGVPVSTFGVVKNKLVAFFSFLLHTLTSI